jgi:hypothetical protein
MLLVVWVVVDLEKLVMVLVVQEPLILAAAVVVLVK